MELLGINGITVVSIIVGVVVGLFAIFIWKRNNRREIWRNVGEDVVVLHMYPRGRHIPNISPFVLKLETYLRMAGIPYEVDFDEPTGPKGKCPWITINGEDMGDSQLIIEMLAKKFDKDFSAHLTPEQKGIALAMRITLEEHFLWCLAIWRFGVDGGKSFLASLEVPRIFRLYMPILKRKILNTANTQGLGRHSHQEVEGMGRQDLRAVSAFLGDKPFFMGEEPTEVDCVIFAFVAQLFWGSPKDCTYRKMAEGEFINLKPYCLRMRERYWSDWNAYLKPQKAENKEEAADKGILNEDEAWDVTSRSEEM